MPKLSKKDIIKIMSTKLNKDQKDQFFIHCNKCLEKYSNSEERLKRSPHDAMNYEMSSYPFTMPDKTRVGIAVLWCKRCGNKVWDSRHLTNLF